MKALIEQAARILEHEPSRSMELEPLHRRAARESGDAAPRPAFMEALRKAADRFAVIDTDPVGAAEGWDQRHRALYRSALESVGALEPIVVLIQPAAEAGATGGGPASTMDVLTDVHESLALLLRSADGDESLHAALSTAIGEMQVLRRYLAPGVDAPGRVSGGAA